MLKEGLAKSLVGGTSNLLRRDEKENLLNYALELYRDSIGASSKTKVDLERYRKDIEELSPWQRREIFERLSEKNLECFAQSILGNGLAHVSGSGRNRVLEEMADEYFSAANYFLKEFGDNFGILYIKLPDHFLDFKARR